MLHIGNGLRAEWEFDYSAAACAKGAAEQEKFRRSRVKWWKDQKDKLMIQIRKCGLDVSESLAAQSGYLSNAVGTRHKSPRVVVRDDFQLKLEECHNKIQDHQQAAEEYAGWVQVLKANPKVQLKLTQADWLYFFGKV